MIARSLETRGRETVDGSRHRWRGRTVAIALLVLLVIAFSASLARGAVTLSVAELWQAAIGQGKATHQTILWELRLPRTVAAVLVGSALSLSGALLQGMIRNSLATPFLLGLSAGAGFVAVLMLTLGLPQSWIPLSSWLGAAASTVIVFLIAKTKSGIAIDRLILGGVALNSIFFAMQTILLLFADDGRTQLALNWLVGSLSGRSWGDISTPAPLMVAGAIAACLLARTINLLNTGEERAASLGVSVGRSRLFVGVCASLLAACAVSIAGLVSFVGLIVPHGVRLLVGTDYRWVLPLSAIGGAVVLLVADTVARFGAVELPAGAVTALLGSPFFLWLLYRRSAA